MGSQAWNRFKEAMSAFASQCPLFGVCHRAFTSLTSAVRRSDESGAASQPAPSAASAASAPSAASAASATRSDATPVILTSRDFPRLIERAKGVALVDFWAPWCMPCRRVGPTIERLAREYDGRATVGKLNVDENMGIARRYGVSGIPMVGVFHDGKLINQLVGVQSERTYRQALESALAQAAPAPASARVAKGH
jgi:thioredoxin 1